LDELGVISQRLNELDLASHPTNPFRGIVLRVFGKQAIPSSGVHCRESYTAPQIVGLCTGVEHGDLTIGRLWILPFAYVAGRALRLCAFA
jgi:hypothetical protein